MAVGNHRHCRFVECAPQILAWLKGLIVPISVTCPNCGLKAKAPESVINKSVKCKRCAGVFVVPDPNVLLKSQLPRADSADGRDEPAPALSGLPLWAVLIGGHVTATLILAIVIGAANAVEILIFLVVVELAVWQRTAIAGAIVGFTNGAVASIRSFSWSRVTSIADDTSTESGRVYVMPTDKPCPYCGETILREAVKCKHCGEFLDEELRRRNSPDPDSKESFAYWHETRG